MAIDWKPTNEIVGRAEKWNFEIFPNDSGRITLFITSRVDGEITEGMECASVEEAKEKAQAWIEEYPHGTWKHRAKRVFGAARGQIQMSSDFDEKE